MLFISAFLHILFETREWCSTSRTYILLYCTVHLSNLNHLCKAEKPLSRSAEGFCPQKSIEKARTAAGQDSWHELRLAIYMYNRNFNVKLKHLWTPRFKVIPKVYNYQWVDYAASKECRPDVGPLFRASWVRIICLFVFICVFTFKFK